MKCIKCGTEHPHYHFRVLQVQTLHVRDFGKNSRIQALGDFEEYGVCAECAERKYDQCRNLGPAVRKYILLYGALMILGLVLTILFWNGEGVFRLGGLGLVVGGGLCLAGNLQSNLAKKRQVDALDPEKARYACAWDCLLEGAPKKQDINDITYIPVDEETLARKNGDLMVLYDLLPEIAVEAHKRIHGKAEALSDTEIS